MLVPAEISSQLTPDHRPHATSLAKVWLAREGAVADVREASVLRDGLPEREARGNGLRNGRLGWVSGVVSYESKPKIQVLEIRKI